MGPRYLEKLLRDLILKSSFDSISIIGASNKKDFLVSDLKNFGYDVDFIDYDPKYDNPRDAIFDDIEFKELVIVCNAEKHYPLGRKIKSEFIIIGDDERHNGDCNPITSCEQIIEQNKLTNIHKTQTMDADSRGITKHIVYGNNF